MRTAASATPPLLPPPGLFTWLFSRSARATASLLFHIVSRSRILHTVPIPASGGFVLASNHISHFDPPLLSARFPRYIDWMAMEELFRKPAAARMLDWVGAFPVHRDGSDRSAIRAALRRLAAGRVVGMFPEGGIRAGASSILEGAPMRAGVAALAVLSGRPILPCVVIGSDRLYQPRNWFPFRRVPIWITTGAPVAPDPTLPSAAARTAVRNALSSAFVDLTRIARETFQLRDSDLPATPQARKGEDPHAL